MDIIVSHTVPFHLPKRSSHILSFPSTSATVTNLQAKVETLITTNALMKEDLAIAKNTIVHMQDDNDRLRKERGLPTQQQQEQLDKEVRVMFPSAKLSVLCFYKNFCFKYCEKLKCSGKDGVRRNYFSHEIEKNQNVE